MDEKTIERLLKGINPPNASSLPARTIEKEHDAPSDNRWRHSGIPHKGWTCVDVTDLGPPSEDGSADRAVCEMCGFDGLRFVHTMEHDDFEEQLDVGCVCAMYMSSDYVNPKKIEGFLRNKATRKKKWPGLNWKMSRKGNTYLKKDGVLIVIFPSKFRCGRWSYVVDKQFSSKTYASEEEAKLASFDEYWDIVADKNKTCGEGAVKSRECKEDDYANSDRW